MGGMRNFMDSKLLALSVLILFLATLVSIGCALLPFWFRLKFGPEDATYGSMGSREQELQTGLFYMYKPNKPGPERTRVLMTSLLAMQKSSNLPVVPPLFQISQIFYTIGVFGTAVGMAGAFILAFRQYGSLTGNCGLMFFTLLAAICQVLGVLFAIFQVADSGATWHLMPLEDPFRVVITSHPTMYIDWGYYIAVIGAVLSLFGSILLIIESMKVCKNIESIRTQQRRTKPPADPYPDIRYTRFSYADVPRPRPDPPMYHYEPHHHGTPGMVLSRGPPQQQFIAQPQPSPQPPRYPAYQPSPSPDTSMEYKPPPAFVSRQVDL